MVPKWTGSGLEVTGSGSEVDWKCLYVFLPVSGAPVSFCVFVRERLLSQLYDIYVSARGPGSFKGVPVPLAKKWPLA